MLSELLTPAELAARLHTSPNVLNQWRYLGRGPKFVKVGRKVQYRVSDVEEWLTEQTRESAGMPQHA